MKIIYELSFTIGYQQLLPSRTIRRFFAKTEIHRAWLAGNQGCIGEPDGVLYRNWHTNRKCHKNASLKQIWRGIRTYHGC